MRPDQPEADVPDGPRAGADRSPAARGDIPAATAPPSRAGQLAEHARLRESVAASDRAAADRAAWTDAVPGLRAEWASHKERYPDRAQAAARTEPDGSWTSGEHRRLDPEQNTEASKAHTDLADEARRDILPAMRRVEAADPGRKLAGLEHMVKGEDRLKEKLADILLVEPQLTPRDAVAKVADAVRFTLFYDAERYTNGVLADVERLKTEGYEEIKLKNLWHTDQYKGVNSQWRSAETGTRFEMQFHTPESLEAKELTHQAYERLRRPESETSQEERSELEAFQTRANGLVASPPLVENIRDFPEKRR